MCPTFELDHSLYTSTAIGIIRCIQLANNLKGKKGSWVKPGNGGSYRGYQYERAAPKAYKKTSGQKKVGEAGRKVGTDCKGKTGATFSQCRHDVMVSIFGN